MTIHLKRTSDNFVGERHRPAFHFTPPKNWMNDPNGLVHHNGEYHLFYQHNPFGREWGHMHWGHAVSRDLISWKHLPLALCEEEDGDTLMFSGSVVVDHLDSSGLSRSGAPAMVALYTANRGALTKNKIQTLNLAWSLDCGRTFEKNPGNPLIDLGSSKFGDPKVFWHEPSKRWIMVAIEGELQGKALFWGSANLFDWDILGEFGDQLTAPGIWECPDLFPLSVDGGKYHRWVLITSVVHPTPTGGTELSNIAFVGDFDGTSFVRDRSVPVRRIHHGQSYASATFNDVPDGRRLLMAWIPESADLRGQRVWTGAQTMPRELSLKQSYEGLVVSQLPASEIQMLRGTQTETPEGRELEISADFEATGSAPLGLEVLKGKGKGSPVRIGWDPIRAELFIICSEGHRVAAPLAPHNGRISLSILVDRSIIEVFANEGIVSLTAISYPNPDNYQTSWFGHPPLRMVGWPLHTR
ncbi:MAG: glycoside hydrolase family 32 protein [Deltaproteobacteria bacterium]|nr:glycoside hydrolase family 32 protein [Deltaproteobacteria bacterium]